MKYKVFLAGPIKDNKNNDQATHEFRFRVMEKIINQAKIPSTDELAYDGFSAFNPCWLRIDPTAWNTEDLVTIDMAAMNRADVVIFLPGWDLNDGSMFESDYVIRVKKPHVYLTEEELSLPLDELCAYVSKKLSDIVKRFKI